MEMGSTLLFHVRNPTFVVVALLQMLVCATTPRCFGGLLSHLLGESAIWSQR